MSAAVQPPSRSRSSRPRSGPVSRGAARRSRAEEEKRSPSSCCGVRVGHSRPMAARTSGSPRNSRAMSSTRTSPAALRSGGAWSPSISATMASVSRRLSRSRPATCRARASTTSRMKTGRAWLCGRRDLLAFSLARTHISRSSRSTSRWYRMSTARRGTCCLSLTAAATTRAMASLPLMTETSAVSSRCALTPGYSSLSVDSTTPVSPSAGSTCPMYRRNVAFGPTMSTPRFSSCRRWV